MDYSKLILLDGGMGTMLQAAGMRPGEHPEVWNITDPEAVKNIHKQYINAGSDCIYANTFCGNALKLKGTGYSVADVVAAGIKNAKDAVKEALGEGSDRNVLVALDIGPSGELLDPYGDMEFEEAVDLFAEMVTAGVSAGADLIIIETMSDLEELKAAVTAAKENSSLPVWTTMTFEKNGRTFMGISIEQMAQAMNEMEVDAMGFNCSVGPEDLLPLVEELRQFTERPIILKPNAGLPDTATGLYNVTPSEFARDMKKGIEEGAVIIGGCCGTNPEYISELNKLR